MKVNQIKIVVVNENTMAYQRPEAPHKIEVIQALITKKPSSRFHNYNHEYNFHLNASDVVRLARPADFDEYRISMPENGHVCPIYKTEYIYDGKKVEK